MIVNLYKKDLVLTIIYVIILQTSVYLVNFIATHTIDRSSAGDFFATISLLNFLSNIFCFGASYVLAKNIPLFKIKFANSIWKNLKSMSVFYFKLFFVVLIVAVILDLIFYKIHLYHYLLWETRYYHPVELFLFTVFIIISNGYFFSLFRAYGKIEVSYYCSILSLLFSMALFITSYYFKIYIGFMNDVQENIMFNYIIFQLSAFLVSLILMFVYFIVIFVAEVSLIPNQGVLFEGWKSEIKYFFLNSVQNDWVILSVLILEFWSINEGDIAVFAYMFGIIGIMYTAAKIAKQMYRNYIAEFIVSNDYYGAKKFIVYNLIIIGMVITAISAGLLFYHKTLLACFGIYKYAREFIVLVLVELYSAEFESILNAFVTLYSKASLRIFTQLNSLLFLTMIVAGSISTIYYQLSGMIWTFVVCTFTITTIEIILFIYCFLQFRLDALEAKQP